MQPIAFIRSPFAEKFGVPRQSGLAGRVVSRVIFTREFSHPDFIRGIEQFSHLWIIWGFHCNRHDVEQPQHATVRPPRFGGNQRLGVFATRSPYRPNELGLSAVRLLEVAPDGSLSIGGADMTDGTPVYDIKPYLPYADALPGAQAGFASEKPSPSLRVLWQEGLREKLTEEQALTVEEILMQDPRPAYHDAPERIYHFCFASFEIDFRVENADLHILRVKHRS